MKTITLTEPHEHEGIEYPPGTQLTLTVADADWLIGVGRAKAAVATSRDLSAPTPSKAAPAPKAIESTQDKEQQAWY